MGRFVIGIRRSNLVMVHWFLIELSLLNSEKIEIFTFRSLTFVWMNIWDSNCICRFVIGMRRSSLNLVMVRWVFDRVISLEQKKKKNRNFQFLFLFISLSLEWLHTFNSNLIYGFVIGLHRSSMNWSWSEDLLQSYPSWRNFQFLLSNFSLDVCIRLKLHV
jgi:hypothetical protein